MESRERYFTGNPQLDFILSQIGNRLDIIEGLRPDLEEGLLKLSSSKTLSTITDALSSFGVVRIYDGKITITSSGTVIHQLGDSV